MTPEPTTPEPMTPGLAPRAGLLPLVADITAAYCARAHLSTAEVVSVITSVFTALDALDKPRKPTLPAQKPAVAIPASVQPDYIVCLEDGRRFKMLRRHLHSAFNMTPEQYRAKWHLRSDYPMVAPTYSQTRSRLAVANGLGRTRRRASAAVA